MPPRAPTYLLDLGTFLNGLPDVFSTPQWGGRAYKVGRREGKAKVLAHVCLDDRGDRVTVSFKLSRPRAEDAVARHEWIEPHSFRTLAPAGWLTASVRTKRQMTALCKLLAESRELYGVAAPDPGARSEKTKAAPATHIDRVMREARRDGWIPKNDW